MSRPPSLSVTLPPTPAVVGALGEPAPTPAALESVPPPLTTTSPAIVAAMVAVWATQRAPPWIVVVPVYVLAPVSVSEPACAAARVRERLLLPAKPKRSIEPLPV